MAQPISIIVQDFDLKVMDSCLNILIFSKYEYFKNHITLINEKAIGVFYNLEKGARLVCCDQFFFFFFSFALLPLPFQLLRTVP